MIDFHSHVLPKMDDGSRSTEESVAMLAAMAEQGVTRVIATPHFYANNESVSHFLERREAAAERLRQAMPDGLPTVTLGAEVRYYQGIARNEDLRRLCIEGTELLLLEMPSARWTEHTAREIADLSSRGDLTVVLAHVERYRKLQQPRVWDIIIRGGALMQMNAEHVLAPFSRRRAIRQLANGEVHFLGSDCHGTAQRPPNLGAAYRCISRRLGEAFTEDLIRFHHSLFPAEEAETSSNP